MSSLPSKCLVIKVGTTTLLESPNDDNDNVIQHPSLSNIGKLVHLVVDLRRQGHRVILVSSGAVGMGVIKLGLTERPKDLHIKQAVAAAGQSYLMRVFEDVFGFCSTKVAQLLITRGDFVEKARFLNIRSTINALLDLGVVPIINENDSVAIHTMGVGNPDEYRFGDNDRLAAMTAANIAADWLFLLTDVDCLYTADPRTNPNATPIHLVEAMSDLEGVDFRGTGSAFGSGGMGTKLVAAKISVCAGIHCGLVNGTTPEKVSEMLSCYYKGGDQKTVGGTLFEAMEVTNTLGDMRRWILALPISGNIICDNGAIEAMFNRKKSLLAAGILSVEGEFLSGECAALCASDGHEFARAVVNYSSQEINIVKGLRSRDIAKKLGYEAAPEVCYRANCIFTETGPMEDSE